MNDCDSCITRELGKCEFDYTENCKTGRYVRKAFCNECRNMKLVPYEETLGGYFSKEKCIKGGYKGQKQCKNFKPLNN